MISLRAASRSAQIDAHVDTVTVQSRLERRNSVAHQSPQVCKLIGFKVFKVRNCPIWKHHQMTRGIGKPIENHKTMLSSVQDKRLGVFCTALKNPLK